MLQKDNKINWMYYHFLTQYPMKKKVTSYKMQPFNAERSVYDLLSYVTLGEKKLEFICLSTPERLVYPPTENTLSRFLPPYQNQEMYMRETCRSTSNFRENYCLVRPLLSVSRFEIRKFCSFWQLPIYPDATNQKVKFLRNRVRKQVLPAVKFFFNPQIENIFLQFADIVEAEDQGMDQIAKEFFTKLSTSYPFLSVGRTLSSGIAKPNHFVSARQEAFCKPITLSTSQLLTWKMSKPFASSCKAKLCVRRKQHRRWKGVKLLPSFLFLRMSEGALQRRTMSKPVAKLYIFDVRTSFEAITPVFANKIFLSSINLGTKWHLAKIQSQIFEPLFKNFSIFSINFLPLPTDRKDTQLRACKAQPLSSLQTDNSINFLPASNIEDVKALFLPVRRKDGMRPKEDNSSYSHRKPPIIYLHKLLLYPILSSHQASLIHIHNVAVTSSMYPFSNLFQYSIYITLGSERMVMSVQNGTKRKEINFFTNNSLWSLSYQFLHNELSLQSWSLHRRCRALLRSLTSFSFAKQSFAPFLRTGREKVVEALPLSTYGVASFGRKASLCKKMQRALTSSMLEALPLRALTSSMLEAEKLIELPSKNKIFSVIQNKANSLTLPMLPSDYILSKSAFLYVYFKYFDQTDCFISKDFIVVEKIRHNMCEPSLLRRNFYYFNMENIFIFIMNISQKILLLGKATAFELKLLNHRKVTSLIVKKSLLLERDLRYFQRHVPFLYTSISTKKENLSTSQLLTSKMSKPVGVKLLTWKMSKPFASSCKAKLCVRRKQHRRWKGVKLLPPFLFLSVGRAQSFVLRRRTMSKTVAKLYIFDVRTSFAEEDWFAKLVLTSKMSSFAQPITHFLLAPRLYKVSKSFNKKEVLNEIACSFGRGRFWEQTKMDLILHNFMEKNQKFTFGSSFQKTHVDLVGIPITSISLVKSSLVKIHKNTIKKLLFDKWVCKALQTNHYWFFTKYRTGKTFFLFNLPCPLPLRGKEQATSYPVGFNEVSETRHYISAKQEAFCKPLTRSTSQLLTSKMSKPVGVKLLTSKMSKPVGVPKLLRTSFATIIPLYKKYSNKKFSFYFLENLRFLQKQLRLVSFLPGNGMTFASRLRFLSTFKPWKLYSVGANSKKRMKRKTPIKLSTYLLKRKGMDNFVKLSKKQKLYQVLTSTINLKCSTIMSVSPICYTGHKRKCLVLPILLLQIQGKQISALTTRRSSLKDTQSVPKSILLLKKEKELSVVQSSTSSMLGQALQTSPPLQSLSLHRICRALRTKKEERALTSFSFAKFLRTSVEREKMLEALPLSTYGVASFGRKASLCKKMQRALTSSMLEALPLRALTSSMLEAEITLPILFFPRFSMSIKPSFWVSNKRICTFNNNITNSVNTIFQSIELSTKLIDYANNKSTIECIHLQESMSNMVFLDYRPSPDITFSKQFNASNTNRKNPYKFPYETNFVRVIGCAKLLRISFANQSSYLQSLSEGALHGEGQEVACAFGRGRLLLKAQRISDYNVFTSKFFNVKEFASFKTKLKKNALQLTSSDNEIENIFISNFLISFKKLEIEKKNLYWPIIISFLPKSFQRRVAKIILLNQNKKNIRYSQIEDFLTLKRKLY